jgi:photosystem II stability/assembly factor-like uncharacterized protein
MLKGILLSLGMMVLTQTSIIGQWEDISIPVSVTFSSVAFLDNSIGWICGGNEIYKTNDAGENWELVYSGEAVVSIEEVIVINDTTLLAIGKNYESNLTEILRSIDLGLSWTPIENTFYSSLFGVFFTDESVGFCVGTGGAVIRTGDGGLHWEQMNSGIKGNTFLQSVFFTDSLHGIAVGGLPGVAACIRTIDGGFNWEPVNVTSDQYLQSVFFINDQIGFIVGWGGEILVTRDAGVTWTPQTSVNMNGNLEIVFTNDTVGYIVGGMMNEASIQKTYDQGMIWEETGPDILHGLIAIDFPSLDIGYAVGGVGTILKTTNGGVTGIEKDQESLLLSLYPNPVSSTLTIAGVNDAITEVRLMDVSGKLLFSEKRNTDPFQIEMGEFLPGNYYVLVQQGSKRIVRKIVKM